MTDWVTVDDREITFPYVIRPAYVDSDYAQDMYVSGGYISYDVGDSVSAFTTQDKAGTSWQ